MANKSLPDGDYVPTYASAYMLDGFDLDSEYGAGPDLARKDPQLPTSQNGLAALPDGFVEGPRVDKTSAATMLERVESKDLGDLTALFHQTPPLNDLTWLTEAEQDPERLPRAPNDALLEGLREQWAVGQSTDGRGRVPYVEAPRVPPAATSTLPQDLYRTVAASAMRRASYGEPWEAVVAHVVAQLGKGALDRLATDPHMQRLAATLRAIRAELPALGKVYLREAAFPGLLSGKWDREIKRKASGAAYWVARPGSKLAALDNYLGRPVVAAVPWERALEHYRPALQAAGVRVAGGDPKAALLAALAAPAPRRDPHPDRVARPIEGTGLTAAQAWERLAAAPVPERKVVRASTLEHVAFERAWGQVVAWQEAGLLTGAEVDSYRGHPTGDFMRKAAFAVVARLNARGDYAGPVMTEAPALAHEGPALDVAKLAAERAAQVIHGMVRAGALTAAEGDRVLQADLTPAERVRVAAAYSSVRKAHVPAARPAATYAGAVMTAAVAPRRARTAAEVTALEDRVAEAEQVSANQRVDALARAGLLTASDAARLKASALGPKEKLRVAGLRINDPHKPQELPSRGPVARYAGVPMEAHRGERREAAANPLEVRKVLRWATQQMNAGLAGRDLTAGLKMRFALPVLQASSAPLRELRSAHEGLAGHLYVDASAYASVSGSGGCEQGALQHRANAVPAVLAMPRCSSCVFNQGERCGQYSKPLIQAPEQEEARAYAAEIIRLANSHDGERTQSMFARSYDPGEFQLTNDSLDNFDYAMPEHQALEALWSGRDQAPAVEGDSLLGAISFGREDM